MWQRMHRFAYYLRAGRSWFRRDIRVDYLPEYISIEATNVCNFKCSFCPQSSPTHLATVGRSFMSAKGADLLLGRIREAGVRSRLLHWTLDGEPFMNRRFHELCEVACRWGFTEIAFATNGSLCTPSRLLELPRTASYVLGIDYCADRDYFEQVRGTPGSWARVRRNVLAALEDERLGHIRIRLKDISSFDIADPSERRRRFKQLQRLFPRSGRLSFATKTFHNATGFLGGPGDRTRRYHLCPYPWGMLTLASNGDVVACSRDLERKTVLGNLSRSRWRKSGTGCRCGPCAGPERAGARAAGGLRRLRHAVRSHQVQPPQPRQRGARTAAAARLTWRFPHHLERLRPGACAASSGSSVSL